MKKILFLLFLLLSLSQPVSLFALVESLHFGGFVGASVPCTCMAPGTVRVQYLLLHPIPFPWVTHSLLLTPSTVRYAHQEFLAVPPPTAWHLGKYIPSPAMCLVGVPPDCAPLPTDGTILYLGSSFPGFTLF